MMKRKPLILVSYVFCAHTKISSSMSVILGRMFGSVGSLNWVIMSYFCKLSYIYN
jgi:hypothetical protein